jgi:hypothetical protein
VTMRKDVYRTRQKSLFVWMILLALPLWGCAAAIQTGPAGPVAPAPVSVAGDAEKGWWRVSFQMDWPEDQEKPAWYMDLCLAHMVLSPVIDHYKASLVLYRFHRRAMRDREGHRFSFIFYATPQTARRVFEEIKTDKNVAAMIGSGKIVKVVFDDSSGYKNLHIEDTSDPKWSPAVRKSWPYYIMGASQMWLHLIDEIIDEHPEWSRPEEWPEAEDFYRGVDGVVNDLWQEEGRHAFLHHLNALFGYESLVVYEKKLMTF